MSGLVAYHSTTLRHEWPGNLPLHHTPSWVAWRLTTPPHSVMSGLATYHVTTPSWVAWQLTTPHSVMSGLVAYHSTTLRHEWPGSLPLHHTPSWVAWQLTTPPHSIMSGLAAYHSTTPSWVVGQLTWIFKYTTKCLHRPFYFKWYMKTGWSMVKYYVIVTYQWDYFLHSLSKWREFVWRSRNI